MQTEAFNAFSVKNSKGSVNPYINFSDLERFEFALPPINEQIQFIQVLAASRECADAYQESEAALKTLLLSRTDELFSGQVDDKAKAQVIGDIAEVQYGLTINAKRRTIEKQSPYLRVANVQRFHIDLSEVKDVGVDSKDDGCILQRNDILVVEGHADIAELGRASIWENQLPMCLHQNHLIRIRCRPGVDPYYVLEYVNSPVGRAYFRGRGKSTSGLNTLNSTIVREMPIPIPSLTTQKSIADEMKKARRSLKEISDRKEQHTTVSKWLSAVIFGGRQG
jgi:restriction endonuclease S subunit